MKMLHLQALGIVLAVVAAASAPSPASAAEVVIVSAKSPVGPLTAEQVSQLFLAKTASLPGGGAAVLIDQAEGSATRDAFYTKVTGRSAAQMKALWSRLVFSGAAQLPKSVDGHAAVKKAVAETTGAVGYIDKSAVDATVKVIYAAE